MNRKQKIIVSITGITVVLLALLGITYAYYLTRIQGNTNTNSISITTADLSLVYRDGTTEILTSDTLLIPGEFEGTKDFTVTNNGNSSVTYGVILEDMINPLTRPQDMKMTLSCSSDKEDSGCSGLDEMSLPSTNEFLVENIIEVGETHTYELKLRYIEAGEDQSIDMGKTISGKLNIIDSHDTVDMTGTVASYEEGDYVQVNSEPKISYITKDGKYKVVGLKPEHHTIAVYNKDGNLKGDKEFTIKSGTTESISENEITITKDTRTITMNVTAINNDKTITTGSATLNKYNPFKSGTLAYEILNNANNVTEDEKTLGYAEFVEKTYFKVAEEIPVYKGDASLDISSWYLFDSYSDADAAINEGLIWGDTLTAISSCNEDSIGKYLISTEDYSIKGPILSCDSDAKPVIYDYIDKYESSLSLENDDYGNTYYFRGNVMNNYLSFAGMCWRIVRIAGDNSIKLTLEDQDEVCSESIDGNWGVPHLHTGNTYYTRNYGYSKTYVNNSSGSTSSDPKYVFNYLQPTDTVDRSMVKFFYDFQINNLNGYLNKLKSGDWCIADESYSSEKLADTLLSQNININDLRYSDTVFYFDSYVRLAGNDTNGYKPMLKCTGTNLAEFQKVDYNSETVIENADMYVGALTADEVVYAGAKVGALNKYFYLMNESFRNDTFDYYYFYTMSPGKFGKNGFTETDFILTLNGSGGFNNFPVHGDGSSVTFRPTINLKPETQFFSGNGSLSNPYVIE